MNDKNANQAASAMAAATGVSGAPIASPIPGIPVRPRALLLDFDGVVVESVTLKINAFFDVYADVTPEQHAQIEAYQRVHGGVGRGLKFRHFEKVLYGRDADDERIRYLSNEYARRVYEAVVACPYVDGAEDFLRAVHGKSDMHVISGTPVDELANICRRRNIAQFFTSIHGAPETKRDAFRHIVETHGYDTKTLLAIGDATTERDAARALGIAFLGVVPDPDKNPFSADEPVIPNLVGLAARLGF
jgi:phosphoglycolate phosphatase